MADEQLSALGIHQMPDHSDGMTRGDRSTAAASTSESGDGGAAPWITRTAATGGGLIALLVLATTPALAQDAAQQFCETPMATTVINAINVVQFAGPLLGGFLAIGSVVVLPVVRRADMKREIKSIRNQALIWGVVVAPLGTAILKFILNGIVAGASSCGF